MVYLPLGHSSQVAHTRVAAQEPHELSVLKDVALGKDDAPVWVKAYG